MNKEMKMTGHCLCGAVTFTAKNVELDHHACHCDMCRRWSGSPFFGIHAEKVTFTGDENIVRYESSAWASRGFCLHCGSNLFYYLKPDEHYSMCAGAFDDQSRFRLTSEIFIDQKPKGYAFDGGLPKMTGAEVFAAYEKRKS